MLCSDMYPESLTRRSLSFIMLFMKAGEDWTFALINSYESMSLSTNTTKKREKSYSIIGLIVLAGPMKIVNYEVEGDSHEFVVLSLGAKEP